MSKENQCTGSYPVSGYTRGNGIEVDSYIRNCWKHSGSGSSPDTLFEYGQENISKIDNDIIKLSGQDEVSDNEVYNIYSNLFEVIDVILKISDEVIKMGNNMPTEFNQERISQGNKLNKAKDNLEEMIYKAIGTSFNIQKVSNKNWSKIDTKDKNYYAKLKKHITIEDIRKRISNNLSTLHKGVLYDNKNEFENALTECKNYMNIAKAKLSEKTIDTIFNVSNNKKIDVFKTPDGQNFWEYSKGNIKAEQMNTNGVPIKENHSINDIKSIKLRQFIKKKVEEQTGQDDCRGLVFNKDTELSKKFAESDAIKNYVNNFLNSEQNDSIHFDSFKETNLFSVIGRGDIYKTTVLPNGNIEVIMVDVYDFNNDINPINKIGYNAQKGGIVKPFYSIIFIEVKKETLKK